MGMCVCRYAGGLSGVRGVIGYRGQDKQTKKKKPLIINLMVIFERIMTGEWVEGKMGKKSIYSFMQVEGFCLSSNDS